MTFAISKETTPYNIYFEHNIHTQIYEETYEVNIRRNRNIKDFKAVRNTNN